MMSIALAAQFAVTLQPLTGVGGGPVHITVEAHDSDQARRQLQAQYRDRYRISDVRRINR